MIKKKLYKTYLKFKEEKSKDGIPEISSTREDQHKVRNSEVTNLEVTSNNKENNKFLNVKLV